MFTFVINLLFPSRFIFADGSRVDYLIREDLLQYSARIPQKDIVDIPLRYDEKTDRSHVDPAAVWKWQSTGTVLTQNERRDVARKINIFLRRRPREFEPLPEVD